MTCIVAIKENGTVYVGADSAAANGWEIFSSKLEKVFVKGEFIIGYTTSFRMGQLLQYKLNAPNQPDGMDDTEYMATAFVDCVRECLSSGGFSTIRDGQESGGQFIVGYRGEIYNIEVDYQVNIHMDDYAAVGCGANFALGSLFSSASNEPQSRILLALEAASHFSNGVCAPFCVKTAMKGGK
jgi:ATP-dependent protease HslVU (ClpYQ) peptidase subunit